MAPQSATLPPATAGTELAPVVDRIAKTCGRPVTKRTATRWVRAGLHAVRGVAGTWLCTEAALLTFLERRTAKVVA